MKKQMYRLQDLIKNFDSKRIPLSSREREQRRGIYPYYGATSILDYVNDYLFDGSYILLGEDGTVVNNDGSPVLQLVNGKFWVNNHAHVLQNTELVDFYYLYYLLKNLNIKSIVTGAVQQKISQSNLNSYEVEIFEDKYYQKKCASILSSIDEKIIINNAMNNNLEQEAMCLFNHYFPYKINDNLPEGWRIGTFDEIIELHDSKRIPLSGQDRNQMQNKIYPYYGATSLMDYVDNYIFDGIYLLLGEDGTVIDDYGMPILQYVWGKFWVNNHAHIITGKRGYSVESLYLLLKQTPIKSIVTGAVQAKISQTNLKALNVIIPPENLITEFNVKIEKLFSLIRNNKDENEKLIQLRDTLLPKLMSGEIDVSNVDISTDKLSFSEK